MAQRQPRHQGANAADILAESDRTTRRASTSSERAREVINASEHTRQDVAHMQE